MKQVFMWHGKPIPQPELKPCAHCGAEAEFHATFPIIGDDDSSEWVMISCTNRFCLIATRINHINWKLEQPYHAAFEKLAEIWNKRT